MQFIRYAVILLAGILPAQHLYAQLKDSSDIQKKLDSAGNQLKSKASQLKDGVKQEAKSLLSMPGNELRSGWKELKSAATIPGLNNLKPSLFAGSKPLSAKMPAMKGGYAYMKDATGADSGTFHGLNSVFNYEVNAGVSLLNMPFNFSFNGYNDVYSFNNPSPEKLLRFNFDQKAYLDKLRKQVTDKISPDAVLAATTQRIQAIRQKYEQQLKQELHQLQQAYQKEYKDALTIPVEISDLSATDLVKTQSLLFTESDRLKYEESLLRLQQPNQSDSSRNSDKAMVEKMETLKKVYSKVLHWKEKFTGNKTVQQLQSHLPFTPDKFNSFLKDPANLEKVIGDHAELSTLQKIFMSMKKFDVGQNSVESGDFGMQQLVNSGINAEYKSRKANIGFIYGKNNTPNNWLQGGLMNNIGSEYSSVTGFKFGTGTGSPIEQTVSVNFYDYKNTNGQEIADVAMRPGYTPALARRDAVITLHTGYAAGQHQFGLDLSKSFGSMGQGNGSKSNAHSKVFSNEGQSNYAGMLSYDGQIKQSDVRIFIKKVGLGYNNPGNYLLRRGETQVGFGFGRQFLNRKLSVKYATDFKNQIFDPAKRYTHQAFSNKFQFGYKFTRNNRINLTYQRSDFHSKLFGNGSTSGANTRWQADGNYTVKIGSRKLISNVLISRMHFDMPMLQDSSYKSNNTLFSYTATTFIKQSPLSLTILVNRSDNKEYLFNTSMFSAETNYAYNASSKIRMSSGLGYYSNTGWNKQIGGRQQFSSSIMERIDLDLEVSYKKAVKIIRKEMADQLFVTAAMRMNF